MDWIMKIAGDPITVGQLWIAVATIIAVIYATKLLAWAMEHILGMVVRVSRPFGLFWQNGGCRLLVRVGVNATTYKATYDSELGDAVEMLTELKKTIEEDTRWQTPIKVLAVWHINKELTALKGREDYQP